MIPTWQTDRLHADEEDGAGAGSEGEEGVPAPRAEGGGREHAVAGGAARVEHVSVLRVGPVGQRGLVEHRQRGSRTRQRRHAILKHRKIQIIK